MDRTGADFAGAVQMMKDRIKANAVPVQIPIGEGDMFRGVIDLVANKAIVWHDEGQGATWDEIDIPGDLKSQARHWRINLLEAFAEHNDALLMKYLEGEEITAEIRDTVRAATLSLDITPVFCGSAFKNKGVQRLLDGVIDYLPAPTDVPPVTALFRVPTTRRRASRTQDAPFSAIAFKIATDPYVGKLTFFRSTRARLRKAQSDEHDDREERAHRAHPLYARQQPRGRRGGARRRHRRGRRSQRHQDGDTLADPDHPVVLEQMDFPEPVIRIAIEPKTKADSDKLGAGLQKLAEEDPTFKVSTDDETGQTLIAGMGRVAPGDHRGPPQARVQGGSQRG